MQIDARIDSTELLLRLHKGERRLAYAVINAINKTALRIQADTRTRVEQEFTIRKPAFFFGTPARPGGVAAKIRPFASVRQGRAYAEVAIAQPPEGRGLVSRRLLLPFFEKGGLRPRFTPQAKHVAVPITGGPARPTRESSIAREYTFAGLRFVAYRGGKRVQRAGQRAGRRDQTMFGAGGRVNEPVRGPTQWKGRNRTFIAMSTRDTHPGAVLQRIGPGRRDVRPVYVFRKPMQLPSRLRWVPTARAAADQWFAEELQRETVKALEHARGRGL
jgi:hypothetical protein